MPKGVLFQIGNHNVGPAQLLIFVVTAVLVIALLELDDRYWKRRLTKWVESQHLELVSFQGASIWEGPAAFLNRSRNQRPFRVVTKAATG